MQKTLLRRITSEYSTVTLEESAQKQYVVRSRISFVETMHSPRNYQWR